MIKEINEYLEHLECYKNYSKNTLDSYRRTLLRFSKKNSNCCPKKVTKKDIECFISHLFDVGLSASTRRVALEVLRSFFTYLKKEKVIKENLFLLIESPKMPQTIPLVLNQQEITLLFDSVKGVTFKRITSRLILEILYGSGLRVSEACDLKITDICVTSKVIRIMGKGQVERIVPFGSQFLEALEIFIKLRVKLFGTLDTNIHLFVTNNGVKKLSRNEIWKRVKDIVDSSKINKNITPHTLRHTFATHLLIRGAPLNVIQELLGHSSIRTTQLYLNLDISEIQKSFDKHHPRS